MQTGYHMQKSCIKNRHILSQIDTIYASEKKATH